MASDAYGDLYISCGGKQLFKKQLESLSAYFAILPDGDVSAFKKFLDSPFLVSNRRLCPLFSTLFAAYQSSNSFIQGSALSKKLYGHTDILKDQRRLKQDFKQLEGNINRFFAYQFLNENPAEENRLFMLARNGKPEEKYSLKLAEPLAGEMLGVQTLLHKWVQYHFTYFTTEGSYGINKFDLLKRAEECFNDLTRLVNAFYSNELVSGWKFYNLGKELNPEQANPPNALTQAYEMLSELRHSFTFKESELSNILRLQRDHHKEWLPMHRFMVWQYTLNYVTACSRASGDNYIEYLSELLSAFGDQEIYLVFNNLPRGLYLNLVKMALLAGEIEKAEELHRKFSPMLLLDEQPLTTIHAEISIHFYKEEYTVVLEKLTEHFERYKMQDPFHDGVRLKSYRLRSALVLAEKHGDWDIFDRACSDFEKFLYRKKVVFDSERTLYYESFLQKMRELKRVLCSPVLERKKAFETFRSEFKNQNPASHAYNWIANFIENQIIV
ncbi:MAG: hypothetical protein NXI25_10040 [bacterium]|nr:hypothetical protein [bacterium]